MNPFRSREKSPKNNFIKLLQRQSIGVFHCKRDLRYALTFLLGIDTESDSIEISNLGEAVRISIKRRTIPVVWDDEARKNFKLAIEEFLPLGLRIEWVYLAD